MQTITTTTSMAVTASLLFAVVLSTTLFEPYLANPLHRRGLPLPPDHATSVSHYGNRFSISFPSSTYSATYYILLIPELPTPIELTINITDSLSFQRSLNESETAAIARSSRFNLNSSHAVVLPTDPAVNRNILIYSSFPNQTFSVTGVAHSEYFTSTFLALPSITHDFIQRYQYTQFSLPVDDVSINHGYSMFLLSDVFNGVAPFALAPPDLAGRVQIRDVYRLFGNTQRTIQGFPTPFRSLKPDDTFHFESSDVDMTGITVWGDEPFNFIASQICGNPTSRNCRQVIEQVPPSHTWGYLFHLMPFEDSPNPGYLIRIRPRYPNSSVTCSCHDDIQNRTTFSLEGLDITIDSQIPCVIIAEHPVAVMQYYIEQEDFALMAWVAPASQYLQSSTFYVPSFGPDFKHYITLAVNENCFNASLILMDGLPIDSDPNSWTALYCSNATSDVCGYGYSANVSSRDTRYVVEHVDESCAVNVMSYGWSSSSGYARSCGYKMEPIGIPILSIDHSEYNGDEGDNITISITRRGHIQTDITIRYELRTLDNTPGLSVADSFRTANGLIHISSNTTSVNLVLRGIDNNIAEAESLYIKSFILHLFPNNDDDDVYMPHNTTTIRIKDNDILIVGFEAPVVTVREGSMDLQLILRSNIVDGGNGISVSLRSIDGTALVGEDYEPINNDGVLRPGQLQWSIPYIIRSDSVVEPTEYFTVSLGLRLVRRANIRLGTNSLNVTIIDDDTVSFRFGQANYSIPENNGSVVLVVNMEGATSIPLTVLIETFDITAYAHTDYVPINGTTELTFLNQTSIRVTLFILDDMFLEGNEIFGARLNLTGTQPQTSLAVPSIANVIIQNDDSVSVGFNVSVSNPEVFENEGFANISIAVNGSVSYRDFYIHFETIEDTAKAGTDFIPISRNILFPANTTGIRVSIVIINDNVTGVSSKSFTAIVRGSDSELSFVKVSGRNQIPVSINEDDFVFIRLIDNVTYSGQEGRESVLIPLVRTGVLNDAVEVILDPLHITADPNDYTLTPDNGLITFRSDETIKYLTVSLIDDGLVEGRERLGFQLIPLSAPVRVDLNQRVFLDIFDSSSIVVSLSSAVYVVSEGRSLTIELLLTGGDRNRTQMVEMTAHVSPRAAQGVDLLLRSMTFSILSNSTSYTFYIDTIDDRKFEGQENFTINVTTADPNVLLRNNTATIVIEDNDNITLSMRDAELTVSESIVSVFLFVEKEGQTDIDIPLLIQNTNSDTAVAGSDYIIRQRIDFPSNQSITALPVIIINDDIVEESMESFTVGISSLLSLSGIIINRNSTRINIRDNDVIRVSFSSSIYTVNETDGLVFVFIDVFGSTELNLQPFFMTISGTARAGFDYTPVMKALNLTSSRVIVPIALRQDTALENRESFMVSLTSNSSSLIVNRSRAVVYIEDSTNPRALVIITSTASTQFHEYEDFVVIRYTFIGEFEKSVFFNVIAVDINTTSGVDYRDEFQTIEKLPNETTKDVVIPIINDDLVEGTETFIVFTTTAEQGLAIPLDRITITIIDDDREVSSVCTLHSSSTVYPFPSRVVSYRYRSSCEHIVLKRCGLTSPYLLTALYEGGDLDKIGFQATDTTLVIFKNLSLISENLGGPIRLGEGLVEFKTRDLVVNVSRTAINILLNETGLLINVRINQTIGTILTVTDLGRTRGGVTCGLCGTLNGTLYLSNEVDTLVLNGSTVEGGSVDDFVHSWVVNPEERLSTSGDIRPECGLLVNDSITADPLFRLPLPPFTHGSPSTYLCYEILGRRGDTFNLVSDRCLSVSALYVSMNNPADGNVIGAISIKTVDNNGSCISMSVSHETDNNCSLMVNGVSRTSYDEGAGVVMTADSGRVRVSIANCEKEGVVMLVTCGFVDGQRMIDFVISRGANLRQTSHGLLGQFWNTPITVAPYNVQLTQSLLEDFDQTQLYAIQISPAGGTSRQFIGELYQRSWDRSFKPCLYVGSSQGGKLKDIPGPSGSVIEGSYVDYLVSGPLATNFKFSRFKNSFCPSN